MNKSAQSNPLSNNRRLLIAGASGLVGSNILQEALNDDSVAEVHVIGRRELSVRHPKLTVQVVNFSAIPPLSPVDEVYLALGTTIKQAGSQSAFRAVDFDANFAVAQAGLAAGARRIGLVSAMMANSKSTVFYNRVKGELEDALTALSPDTLVIVRPSVIVGDRESLNQPRRFGEKIGIWLGQRLGSILPADYRPIQARFVARALLAQVPVLRGKTVLLSGDIQRFENTSY